MIDRKEVLRYLRTRSQTDDPALLSLIDSCTEKAYRSVQPKTIYRICHCSVEEDGVRIDSLRFPSKKLALNLAGCTEVVAFAATLGIQADTLLRTAKADSTAELMIYQAVLAAMTEEVCDKLEQSIIEEHGVRLRQRFSPGYFDLKLETQKTFFELMDITKRIGISLTDSMLMVPSKSVTAFIGIEHED